ncbi:MAG TPA: hypothetical protein VGM88_05845 [Kofleriaceae bacterium]|jgi:hypothetical protein
MGAERVLQAVLVVAAIARAAAADPVPRLHESIAVIDLGPDDAGMRKTLVGAAVDAGFDVADAQLDALSGVATDIDEAPLAAALAAQEKAFGALDCATSLAQGDRAIGFAAARQAASYLENRDLVRAWTYELLCADSTGDTELAMRAAQRIRLLGAIPEGAVPNRVPVTVWQKYPAMDLLAGADTVDLEIDSEPGAAIWIDFERAGVAPLHVTLTAGAHVIAAAKDTKRGWAAGTTDRKQKQVTVPIVETAPPYHALAATVTSWGGAVPSPKDLGAVLDTVHARVALIRHHTVVEVWGRVSNTQVPRLLGEKRGGGVAPVAQVSRVLEAAAETVAAWNEHAPDPDRALLTESTEPHSKSSHTKWWIYAAIGAAVVTGAIIVYAHDSGDDMQSISIRGQ